ncbi:hypothetical protein HU200_019001 [Digitaria exilis]|uniref:Dilute domain-containing protein n=1 Tax=Digitaria exilis TaxID=1010633 RepID=A0A835F3T5_9POAL|nr:hypothetical protein HU200_019001 [Digitaria exilis]
MKAQAESQERNLQLLTKLEDVDKKIGLLQGSVQRLGDNTAKDTLLLSERREKDALKKALTESEYKNEELLIKIEEANKKVEHLQNTINSIKEDMATSLEAERQENETIRRSLVEAQERNDVLFKKVRDSEYRAHQLQDTVQKLQVDAISRLSNFVMEKQEGDDVKNAYIEVRGRKEDLVRRNEDLLKINDDLVKKIEDSGILVTQFREKIESAQSIDGTSGFQQIEAKYPALLFKQQLVDQIEKVYGIISERMKKELNPLLELCIQVISLKPIRTWEEIRNDICPALSLQQLERIVGMYWDDLNGTNFISSMRSISREESNSVSSFSVLLDDDSSIPFSLEDISKSMPNIEEMSVHDLLPFIRENQSFTFILQ